MEFRRHKLNELKEYVLCSFFLSCIAVKSRTGSEKEEDKVFTQSDVYWLHQHTKTGWCNKKVNV